MSSHPMICQKGGLPSGTTKKFLPCYEEITSLNLDDATTIYNQESWQTWPYPQSGRKGGPLSPLSTFLWVRYAALWCSMSIMFNDVVRWLYMFWNHVSSAFPGVEELMGGDCQDQTGKKENTKTAAFFLPSKTEHEPIDISTWNDLEFWTLSRNLKLGTKKGNGNTCVSEILRKVLTLTRGGFSAESIMQ